MDGVSGIVQCRGRDLGLLLSVAMCSSVADFESVGSPAMLPVVMHHPTTDNL